MPTALRRIGVLLNFGGVGYAAWYALFGTNPDTGDLAGTGMLGRAAIALFGAACTAVFAYPLVFTRVDTDDAGLHTRGLLTREHIAWPDIVSFEIKECGIVLDPGWHSPHIWVNVDEDLPVWLPLPLLPWPFSTRARRSNMQRLLGKLESLRAKRAGSRTRSWP